MANCAPTNGYSDEALVPLILAGDISLFEILVRRHGAFLFRVAWSVLRDDAAAEDAVQDGYISAYEHLAQFEGRARLSTWLARIVYHKALARAKATSREVQLDLEVNPEFGNLAHPSASPEQYAWKREAAVLLQAAIAQLPKDYRRILLMRDFQELDVASTARQLQLSSANVKVRVHRARAMLRRYCIAART
jgi:RNA polymerase sigma-70 factor (ECF subfamily)